MVGRSNVGKSSLINDLAGHKGLARVSNEPGRTRLINLFEVDKSFLLVDLPGYGYAKASKTKRDGFADLIHTYLWEAKQLKLILLVIDARLGPTDLDREMLAYLESSKIPVAMIVNKIDKLAKSEAIQLMATLEAGYPHYALIPHSAITGAGRGEIRQLIQQAVRAHETKIPTKSEIETSPLE